MTIHRVDSFDIESTGLRPYHGDTMFSYCIGNGDTGEVEVWRVDQEDRRKRNASWRRLRDFFKDTSIAKVGHNIKFDLSFVKLAGVRIPTKTTLHDTMLMAQCFGNNELHYSLDYLTKRFGHECIEPEVLERWAWVDGEVSAQFKALGSYQLIDKELMDEYQVADGERTLLLYHTYRPHLYERGERAWNDYRNEVDLIWPTQAMEEHGIRYNHRKAGILRDRLVSDIRECNERIHHYTRGQFINLNSGDQVAHLLFDVIGFKPIAYTSKRPSVNKDVLLELRRDTGHEIFDLILKNRSYVKGLATLDKYEELLDSDGRIHPNIRTNGAHNTGRESCSEPNLQNVSKEASEKNPFPVPLRSVFASDPGALMGFGDYMGIEMRLIVDATGEPELIEVLDANGDVHHPTMECFVGGEYARDLKASDPKRYKVLRGAFKNTGFCVAYGGSTEKVAVTLGKRVDEIMDGDANYRRRFRRVAGFSRSLIGTVKRQGFIETPFGRRLNIPRDKAYIAANYMIQGTAAGVLKRAQVRIHKLLQGKWRGAAKLVLPIHDEVVFSFDRKALPQRREFLRDVREMMIDMPEIRAPLDVEWKFTTTTWDKAKEVRL